MATPKLNIAPTDIPGVYRNSAGVLVDVRNVALSFKSLQQRDKARFTEVLGGAEVAHPADLLRAVALDPRMPLAMRIDAAKAAAPYYAPRLASTTAILGGKGGALEAAAEALTAIAQRLPV